jgi:hypothetical protein
MAKFQSSKSSSDPVGIKDAYFFVRDNQGSNPRTDIKGLTEDIVEKGGELPFGDALAPYGFSELYDFQIGSAYSNINSPDQTNRNGQIFYNLGSKLGPYFAGGKYVSEMAWFMNMNGNNFKVPFPYQNYIYDVSQTDIYNNVKISQKDGVTKYRTVPCKIFHDQCVYNKKLQKLSVSSNFSSNSAHIEYSSNNDYTYLLNPWVTYTAKTYYSNKIDYMVWPKEFEFQRSGLIYLFMNSVLGDYKIHSNPTGFGAGWGYQANMEYRPQLQTIMFPQYSYIGRNLHVTMTPMYIYIPLIFYTWPTLTNTHTNYSHIWYHTDHWRHVKGAPTSNTKEWMTIGVSDPPVMRTQSKRVQWSWLPGTKWYEKSYNLENLYKKIHERETWENTTFSSILNFSYDQLLYDGIGAEVAQDYFMRLEEYDSSPNNDGVPNIENSKLKLIDPGDSITDTDSRMLIECAPYTFKHHAESEWDGMYVQKFMQQISESPYLPEIFLKAADHGHGYLNFEANTTLNYFIKKSGGSYRVYKRGDKLINFVTPEGTDSLQHLEQTTPQGQNFRIFPVRNEPGREPYDQFFWNLKLRPNAKTILYFRHINVSSSLVLYINDVEVYRSDSSRYEIKDKSFSFIPKQTHPDGVDQNGLVTCKISLASSESRSSWSSWGVLVYFFECIQDDELLQTFNKKEDAINAWRELHYKNVDYIYNPNSMLSERSEYSASGYISQNSFGDPSISVFFMFDKNNFKVKPQEVANIPIDIRYMSSNETIKSVNFTEQVYLTPRFPHRGDFTGNGELIQPRSLKFFAQKIVKNKNIDFDVRAGHVVYKNKETDVEYIGAVLEGTTDRVPDYSGNSSFYSWFKHENNIVFDEVKPAWKVEYSTDFMKWEPVNDTNNCEFQVRYLNYPTRIIKINSSGIAYMLGDNTPSDWINASKRCHFIVRKNSKYFPKPMSNNHYYFRVSFISTAEKNNVFNPGSVLCFKYLSFVAVNEGRKDEVVLHIEDKFYDILINENGEVSEQSSYSFPNQKNIMYLKRYNSFPSEESFNPLSSHDWNQSMRISCFAEGRPLHFGRDPESESFSWGGVQFKSEPGVSINEIKEDMQQNESNNFEVENIQSQSKRLIDSSWAFIHNLRVKGENIHNRTLDECNYYPLNTYITDNEEISGESLHGPFSPKAKSRLSFLRFEAFRRSISQSSPNRNFQSRTIVKYKPSMGNFLPHSELFDYNTSLSYLQGSNFPGLFKPYKIIQDKSLPPEDGSDGNGWSSSIKKYQIENMPASSGEEGLDLKATFMVQYPEWYGYMNYIIGTERSDGTYAWGNIEKGSYPLSNYETLYDNTLRLTGTGAKIDGSPAIMKVPKEKYHRILPTSNMERSWKNFSQFGNVEVIFVYRKNNKDFSVNPNAKFQPANKRYVFGIKPADTLVWQNRGNLKRIFETDNGEVSWNWNGWSIEVPQLLSSDDIIYQSVGVFRFGSLHPDLRTTTSDLPIGDEKYSLETLSAERTEDNIQYIYRSSLCGVIHWEEPTVFARGSDQEDVEKYSGGLQGVGSIYGPNIPHLNIPSSRSGLKLNFKYFIDLEEREKIELEYARAYWESVITTDMEIEVRINLLDPGAVSGTLAACGPRSFDDSINNVFNGENRQVTSMDVFLDLMDIYPPGTGRETISTHGNAGMLNGVSKLCAIMIHELWHGLGGGFWGSRSYFGYLNYLRNGRYGAEYTGPKGVQKYKEMINSAKYAYYYNGTKQKLVGPESNDSPYPLDYLFSQNFSFNTDAVPAEGYSVETQVNTGRTGGHVAEYARWAGNSIRPTLIEMISPIYDVANSPMTAVGVGMLEDLGYSVNYNAVAKDGKKLIKTEMKNSPSDPIVIYTGRQYYTAYYYTLSADYRNSVSLNEFLSFDYYQEGMQKLTDKKRICLSCGEKHNKNLDSHEETHYPVDPE